MGFAAAENCVMARNKIGKPLRLLASRAAYAQIQCVT